MAFLAVKKGCGGLDLTAMGDPALVGEVASTRDETCTLGSILGSTKGLVLAALEAPLVGAVKESLGLVSILLCAEILALT